MKLKINNKLKSFYFGEEKNTFLKTYKLINQLIWLDPKTYLLNIFLPLPIVGCMLIFWFDFIAVDFSPANLMALFMTPILFVFLFFSFSIINWKKSILFARLKNGGVSKQILISVLVISFMQICISSLLFTTSIIVLVISFADKLRYMDQLNLFVFHTCKEMLTAYSCILTILFYLFSMVFLGFLSILLASVFKNYHVAKLCIIFVFIFFLATSDSLITSNLTTKFLWFQIIGYFNLFKYFVWTVLILNCYANIDELGFQQIVDPYIGFNPFPSIIITVIVCLFTTIVFTYLSINRMNWERK